VEGAVSYLCLIVLGLFFTLLVGLWLRRDLPVRRELLSLHQIDLFHLHQLWYRDNLVRGLKLLLSFIKRCGLFEVG
jgi:hypothetical protein